MEETVTFNLEINVEKTLSTIRQVEGLLFRSLGYMQRLGLPEDVNRAIRLVQRLAMTLRLLHSAIVALEIASGPIGWWRAGLAIVGAGFVTADFATEMSGY